MSVHGTDDPQAATAAANQALPSTEVDKQDIKADEDVSMADVLPTLAPESKTDTPTTNKHLASSPAPGAGRIGTPIRMTNGDVSTAGSRAASVIPNESATPAAMPAEAAPNGAPARQYLNKHVVHHLMDGMKQLAKDQPEDPLRVLGEFLIKRAQEHEKVLSQITTPAPAPSAPN